LRNAIQVEVVSLNSGIRSCFGQDTAKTRVEEGRKISSVPPEAEPLKGALKRGGSASDQQSVAPDEVDNPKFVQGSEEKDSDND